MRPRREPMKRVARMLRPHQALIRNGFVARGTISGVVVEGFNNKSKLTTQKASGSRELKTLEMAPIINWGIFRSQNSPTDFGEEAKHGPVSFAIHASGLRVEQVPHYGRSVDFNPHKKAAKASSPTTGRREYLPRGTSSTRRVVVT